MTKDSRRNVPRPGVSRQQRLSDEGLQRLEQQLQRGININAAVLQQWVKRYGDAARNLLRRYDKYPDDYDD